VAEVLKAYNSLKAIQKKKLGDDAKKKIEEAEKKLAYLAVFNVKTADPALSAAGNGKINIIWTAFRRKMQISKVWKKTKYVEIQCSTDKNFKKNVIKKKVAKGTLTKENSKTAISRLKKGKTYYLRIRLTDGEGNYTKWSNVKEIKTKKN
jgi:hypothetical protein